MKEFDINADCYGSTLKWDAEYDDDQCIYCVINIQKADGRPIIYTLNVGKSNFDNC
jgi:hypothetical protein